MGRDEGGVAIDGNRLLSNLFTSTKPGDFTEVLQALRPLIYVDMNNLLTREISEEDVKKAIFVMNLEKTTGPHGMTALFYQRFWPSLKGELFQLIQQFFRSGSFD